MNISKQINVKKFGDNIGTIISATDKYLKSRDIYNTSTGIVQKQASVKEGENIINEIYNDYLNIEDVISNDYSNVMLKVRPLDIIKVNNRKYIIIKKTDNETYTYPKPYTDDKKLINNSSSYMHVIRPNIKLTEDELEKLNTETQEIVNDKATAFYEDHENSATFKAPDVEKLSEGFLQIGDLIFLVDPSQLSFNTQNGYQFFPTVRTSGDPKIPSIDQVKNMSVVLLFPNEDSINYQLLNLFAMFKRTPFVNIRNKDICGFYKEICSGDTWPYQWLSVALESIHIQSVEGFPNTLQAQITFLPMEFRIFGTELKALRSMRDVSKQQYYLYRDRELEKLTKKAEEKFETDDYLKGDWKDEINLDINKSSDFRESFPFRAFYQSLIRDRTHVLDENGNIAKTEGGFYDSISKYSPTEDKNKLGKYISEGNRKPITFKYRHINSTYRDITKQLSSRRTEEQLRILDSLNKGYDALVEGTEENLLDLVTTSYVDTEDYWRDYNFKFNKANNNMIQEIANSYNITIDSEFEEYKPVKSLFGRFFRSLQQLTQYVPLRKYFNDIQDIEEGRIEKDPADAIGLLNGLTISKIKEDPLFNSDGSTTAYGALQKIWQWLNDGNDKQSKKRKKDFVAFLGAITERLKSQVSGTSSDENIILAREGKDFNVINLPLREDTIEIDNIKDIVTNWSIIFSNKFVPINIQNYKYPYYQHLGSEDVQMSLNIKSINDDSLKNQFSELSEKLQENIKILQMNAPELIMYIDPTLKIEGNTGDIFDTFGINRVVFSNFNTSNIQGSPGSWQTSLSLLQSNIGIEDYHKIEYEYNSNLFINEIASLLSSIVYDEKNNKFEVWEFVNNKTGNIINNTKDIMQVRFHATYGDEISKFLKEFTAKSASPKTYGNYVRSDKWVSDVQSYDTNTGDSRPYKILVNHNKSQMINNLAKKGNFGDALRYVTGKYENILEKQVESIKTLTIEDKGFWESVNDILDRLGNSVFGNIFLLPAHVVVSYVKGAEYWGRVKAVKMIDEHFEKLRTSMVSAIASDFAMKIYKDPPIRNKILTDKFMGSDNLEKIKKEFQSTRLNCYNDFDIPGNEQYVLSPDFYIANLVQNEYEKSTYIKEAIDRSIKIGKLTAMTSIYEYRDALERYNELKDEINVDEEIKKSINRAAFDQDDADIGEKIKRLYQLEINFAKSTEEAGEDLLETPEIVDQFDDNTDEEITQFYREHIAGYRFHKITNREKKIMNLIYSARIKTIVEIFELYAPINEYILGEYDLGAEFKESTKDSEYKKKLDELHQDITTILKNAEKLHSDGNRITSGKGGKEIKLNELNEKFNRGVVDYNVNDKLSLPAVKNLQNILYNKVGFLTRLNDFINEAGANGKFKLPSFEILPELDFLKYWNVRAREANVSRIKLLNEFTQQDKYSNNTSIRMFPTFKIYFIEKDTGIRRKLDDYYTYNAIQSIEIASNKNSSSKTAILRLSNVTNSLTNKMSFMRESVEALGFSFNQDPNDNKFFGTMDIKPGAEMLIKIGYAPDDKYLQTAFQGKIVKMSPGSNIEIIAQSYGAQLQHEIKAKKYGFAATENSHGDIATSILDEIPGLTKLGKKALYGLSESGFSGRGIANLKPGVFDRYLMSNLLGSVSARNLAQDNPRDENIYLPYGYTDNWNNATFDWVVFEQSVWEALNEIGLHNRDTIVTLRNYNTDPLSTKRDERETLVIGKKSGYYKNTDSFSLSSINYQKINKICAEFNKIKKSLQNGLEQPFNKRSLGVSQVYTYSYVLNLYYEDLFNFLQDKDKAMVVASYILDLYNEIKPNENIFQAVLSKISSEVADPKRNLASNIIAFSNLDTITKDKYLSGLSTGSQHYKYFNSIIKGISGVRDLFFGSDLSPEDVYNVETHYDNTDEKYIDDPQYKKIQSHHLASDISDIISNNISLSSNFANMVNLYYNTEPELNKRMNIMESIQNNELNVWTQKAFGAQSDEHSRVMSSYQKNIDTNFYDIVNDVEEFYTKIHKDDMNDENVKTPRWDIVPSYIMIATRLLQKEAAKMYQGTLELVGNASIKPFDILHIEDYTNDMHGAVEVEEVIHRFTPADGFRTTIVPNMITHERDPIQMQDHQVINQIYSHANWARIGQNIFGIALGTAGLITGSIAIAAGGPLGYIFGGAEAVGGATLLWNSTVTAYKKKYQFLYDKMSDVLGRDCINFTALIYHGVPYICGYDGVDYTNLKTIINQNILEVENPITRLAAFSDPIGSHLLTDFDPNEYGIWDYLRRNKIGYQAPLRGYGGQTTGPISWET